MSDTVKIPTNELIGPALNWAVAQCEGVSLEHYSKQYGCIVSHNCEDTIPVSPGYEYKPSVAWTQGGPIVEREGVLGGWSMYYDPECIWASVPPSPVWVVVANRSRIRVCGPTPLIAGMRAFVTRVMGENVDVPSLLL